MSSYYVHNNGLPQNQTKAQASQVRSELDAIAASFLLVPPTTSLYAGKSNYYVDSGAANAYVITASSEVVAYVDGQTFMVKATAANTAASTINVNALGLKSIVRADGTALQANDIAAGQIVSLSYNATTGKFQIGGGAGPQGTIGPIGSLTLVLETGTAVTGVPGSRHALTNVGATTVTLPAVPVVGGPVIGVVPCNGLATNSIARNGNNIMGLAQDMTLNNTNAAIDLVYVNSTVGWRIV